MNLQSAGKYLRQLREDIGTASRRWRIGGIVAQFGAEEGFEYIAYRHSETLWKEGPEKLVPYYTLMRKRYDPNAAKNLLRYEFGLHASEEMIPQSIHEYDPSLIEDVITLRDGIYAGEMSIEGYSVAGYTIDRTNHRVVLKATPVVIEGIGGLHKHLRVKPRFTAANADLRRNMNVLAGRLIQNVFAPLAPAQPGSY